jgi:uncharacterized protein YneF (UPF0154 family)
MSETFDPTARESGTASSGIGEASSFGAQAKENLLAQVKQEPRNLFVMILVISILVSFLLGYFISLKEEESRRQRLLEDGLKEVTDWIRQHGRKVAAPIKEGFEATKSAVEELSHSGAKAGRRWQPFFKKQKRSFLNLF